MELGPVKPRERLVTLDALRGFALLGVLLGNLAHLYSGFAQHWHPPRNASDTFARTFITLVVQSKAQTLLTLLFGFGFATQLLRAEARHEPILGVYWRRIAALLAFGIAHVTLLWWGDVLWTYAVTAPFLLLFLRASNRTRVIVGVLLILVPAMIWALPGVDQHVYGWLLDPALRRSHGDQLYAAIRGTDHLHVMKVQSTYVAYWIGGSWPSYFAWLVGNFLLGYVVGNLRWFERDGAEHLPAFRRLFLVGLVLGGVGTGVTVFGMHHGFDGYILQWPAMLALGAVEMFDYAGLAILFTASVVLLAQRPWWRSAFAILAPVGRMPLTTYLSQSVICTFLIYGWGLGWITWLDEIDYLVLGVAIFIIQIGLCHLWLRKF
ncbi:MAG: DUF418 domain-containing protein, partial [Kofleriaceae bacterium]